MTADPTTHSIVIEGSRVFLMHDSLGLPLSIIISEIYTRKTPEGYGFVIDWSDWIISCIRGGRKLKKIRVEAISGIIDSSLDRGEKRIMCEFMNTLLDKIELQQEEE